MLTDFARTLAKHRHGLLNWYVYPISTGRLEGTNNEILALSRQAYGFHDHQYFELQLYSLHTTRYLLVG
jgi:transposase